MNNNKFLDLTGLVKYDGLIKDYIASGDGALRGELAAAIDAINAKIGELDGSDDKTLAEIVTDIYASIADIVEAQETLAEKDTEIEGKIAEEIGKIVGTLADDETAMTLVEVASSLKSLGDRVTATEGEIGGIKERVTAVEEAIKNLGEIEGGESLGQIVTEVKANTAALESLKGDADTVVAAVNKIAKDAADAAQAAAEESAAADATSKATDAENAAKEYADTLVKDADGNVKFDAVGSAAAAQTAAEATAAADATSKANAAQAAAEQKATDLNTAMDERVAKLEAIDHDQLVADAVAAVVAGAESDFDTLKEVADWINSDTTGAAGLQTKVSEHTESINTINGELDALELKVEGDINNLATHIGEAAVKIQEVDDRLAALDAFVEAHDRIPDADINSLFGITTEE